MIKHRKLNLNAKKRHEKIYVFPEYEISEHYLFRLIEQSTGGEVGEFHQIDGYGNTLLAVHFKPSTTDSMDLIKGLCSKDYNYIDNECVRFFHLAGTLYKIKFASPKREILQYVEVSDEPSNGEKIHRDDFKRLGKMIDGKGITLFIDFWQYIDNWAHVYKEQFAEMKQQRSTQIIAEAISAKYN